MRILIAFILMMLGVRSFAATPVYPASTNANQTFYGVNTFTQPIHGSITGNAATANSAATAGNAATATAAQGAPWLTSASALNGANLTLGSVNSNKLDAATQAQLALAGSGGSGTNLLVSSNYWTAPNVFAGGISVLGINPADTNSEFINIYAESETITNDLHVGGTIYGNLPASYIVGSISATHLVGTVSITDLGAVGDGVTDNTLVISNALALGTNLLFPAGVFLTGSQTSTVPQHMIFEAGSILLYKTNATGYLFELNGLGNSLEGPGTFQGNDTNIYAGGPGICALPTPGNRSAMRINCVYNSRISDLNVYNFSGYGISVYSSLPGINNQYNHYFIRSCYLTNCTEAIVLGVDGADSAEYGVITGNKMWECWVMIDNYGANKEIVANSGNEGSFGYLSRSLDGRSHDNVVANTFNHCCWGAYFTNCQTGCLFKDNNVLGCAAVYVYQNCNGVQFDNNFCQLALGGMLDYSAGTNYYRFNEFTTGIAGQHVLIQPGFTNSIWYGNYDLDFGEVLLTNNVTTLHGNYNFTGTVTGISGQTNNTVLAAGDASVSIVTNVSGATTKYTLTATTGSGASLTANQTFTGSNNFAGALTRNGGGVATAVNVLDYGAKPNGSDATAAIQAAINAAATGASGASVFFPVGFYTVSGTLSVPIGVCLQGDGGLGAYVTGFVSSTANPVLSLSQLNEVRNLAFYSGGGAAANTVAIVNAAPSSQKNKLLNLNISHYGYGILLTNSWIVDIDSCVFGACQNCISCTNVNNLQIRNNILVSSTNGVSITSLGTWYGNTIEIIHNDMEENTGMALMITNNGGVTISQNHCEDNSVGCVLYGVNELLFSANTWEGNGSSSEMALAMTNCVGATIEDNSFLYKDSVAVDSTCSEIDLEPNQFVSSGLTFVPSSGVSVTNGNVSASGTVTASNFRGPGTGLTGTASGLNVDGSATWLNTSTLSITNNANSTTNIGLILNNNNSAANVGIALEFSGYPGPMAKILAGNNPLAYLGGWAELWTYSASTGGSNLVFHAEHDGSIGFQTTNVISSSGSAINGVGLTNGAGTFTSGTRTFTHDSTHTVITNTATLTSSEWTAGSQKEWYNGATTVTIDKTNGNITASGTVTAGRVVQVSPSANDTTTISNAMQTIGTGIVNLSDGTYSFGTNVLSVPVGITLKGAGFGTILTVSITTNSSFVLSSNCVLSSCKITATSNPLTTDQPVILAGNNNVIRDLWIDNCASGIKVNGATNVWVLNYLATNLRGINGWANAIEDTAGNGLFVNGIDVENSDRAIEPEDGAVNVFCQNGRIVNVYPTNGTTYSFTISAHTHSFATAYTHNVSYSHFYLENSAGPLVDSGSATAVTSDVRFNDIIITNSWRIAGGYSTIQANGPNTTFSGIRIYGVTPQTNSINVGSFNNQLFEDVRFMNGPVSITFNGGATNTVFRDCDFCTGDGQSTYGYGTFINGVNDGTLFEGCSFSVPPTNGILVAAYGGTALMFQRCSFYGGATGGYALYLASYGSPLSAIVQNSVFYGDWAYDAISNHGTNTVFTDNIFNGATAAHNGSIAVGSEAVNTIIVNNVGQNKITDAGASTFQWYVTNQLLTVVGKSTNTVSLGAPDVYAGNGFHGNADTATSLASVNATNVISAANLTLGNFTSTVCGYLKFTNNGVTYSLVLSTNNP